MSNRLHKDALVCCIRPNALRCLSTSSVICRAYEGVTVLHVFNEILARNLELWLAAGKVAVTVAGGGLLL